MRRAAQWLLLAGLLFCLPSLEARDDRSAHTLAVVVIAELPPQAHDTLRLIRRGGPFPYARDGIVFGNYERLLPVKPRGYYHEYTVRTPGLRDRGPRRIVCGIVPECFYTGDHYRSFQRIAEDW